MHTENKGSLPTVLYGTLPVDGLSIAYREADSPGSPKLVLLHGFPASSHQYRNLIPALTSRFHVISPDYPGFGNSDLPDPEKFSYTFDQLSEITEAFLKAKDLTATDCSYRTTADQSASELSVATRKLWSGLLFRTQTLTKSASPRRGAVCGMRSEAAHG